VKRKFSSVPYRLQKAYAKITTAKPSVWLIGSVLAFIAIFLLGGGVYDLLERPVIAYFMGEQGRPIFYYPYPTLNEQILGESLFVMILYILGFAGFLIIYQATKYAYKPRQAYIMLIMGITFIVISFAFVEMILQAKLTYRSY